MKPTRIYIVGFMGSGKTTLGKKLARRLGYAFADTDLLIEARMHSTIPELFERLGETGFRQLESEILTSTFDMMQVVVATGGGLACGKGHMEAINAHGVSIYLKASVPFLLHRLSRGGATRPLLQGLSGGDLEARIKDLLNEREACYLRAKHHVQLPVNSLETLVKSAGL